MARITVEDCLEKIDSQYDLVLLAKERTAQLNAGEPSLVPIDNDKNTVVSLREIGEGKISVKSLEDSAIAKLQKQQEASTDVEDLGDDADDDFDKIYKALQVERVKAYKEYKSDIINNRFPLNKHSIKIDKKELDDFKKYLKN